MGFGTKVGDTTYDGTCVFAVLTFGDVNLGGSVLGGWAVDSVELSVVRPVLMNLDVAPGVVTGGLLVAVTRVAAVDLRFGTLSSLMLVLLGVRVAVLFVDMDLFAVLLGAGAVLFVDTDLFFVVGVAASSRRWLVDGGREGFAMLFVTFPSDVRSLGR